MKKFYAYAILVLPILPINAGAQRDTPQKGRVVFKLDNSKNNNEPVEIAYVILDKYDLTGAGFVKKKIDVADNKIVLENLPLGKYYADIYTKGFYQQHFYTVIKVTQKGKNYIFKLDEIGFYIPGAVVIPRESDDYSKK